MLYGSYYITPLIVVKKVVKIIFFETKSVLSKFDESPNYSRTHTYLALMYCILHGFIQVIMIKFNKNKNEKVKTKKILFFYFPAQLILKTSLYTLIFAEIIFNVKNIKINIILAIK